ncbi:WD domain, G-beta repeat-containing protein [Besnoitia besnoiti]|uniref:WD domain, G-beta repeat-containing protein n=1 Tax=Besnoitia besnoiti TaxID=94643 RepID=A0A2A9MFM9_BESBE|nr:WD domain, G-beta repeat-containing protein [Besnoitia besnoiti]PFH34427.1 WD domain, G-beta repeat-containing protein [Besnoitia besnoiti]
MRLSKSASSSGASQGRVRPCSSYSRTSRAPEDALELPVWQYVFLRRAAVRDRVQSRWFRDVLASYSSVAEENVHLLVANASALSPFASGAGLQVPPFGPRPFDGGPPASSSRTSPRVKGSDAPSPGALEAGAQEEAAGGVDMGRVIGALEIRLAETLRRMDAAEGSAAALTAKLEQTRNQLEEKVLESDVLRRLVGEREEELGDREAELGEARKACAFLQNERSQLQAALQMAQQEVMEKALENERYLRELLRYKEAEATRLNEMQQLYVSIMEKQKKREPESRGRSAAGGEEEEARRALLLLSSLERAASPGDAGAPVSPQDSGEQGPPHCAHSSHSHDASSPAAGGASRDGRSEPRSGGSGISTLTQLLSLSASWGRAKAPVSDSQTSSSSQGTTSTSSPKPVAGAGGGGFLARDGSGSAAAGGSSGPASSTRRIPSFGGAHGATDPDRPQGKRGGEPGSETPLPSARLEGDTALDCARRDWDSCRPPTRVHKSLLAHRGSVHACCAVPHVWGAEALPFQRGPRLFEKGLGCADHELLLTCGQDGFLALVDATAPALLYSFLVSPSKAPLLCVDAVPDQRIALVAAADVSLYTVNACSQRVVSTLKGHSGRITACGFLRSVAHSQTPGKGSAARGLGGAGALMTGAGGPNSATLWSCSLDRTVRLWDARRSACVKTTSLNSAVTMGAVSPDGEWLATAHQNGSVSLLNVRTEKCARVASLQLHEDAATGVAFDPRGCLLATQGKDNQVKIVDVRMWKELTILLHIEMRYNLIQTSPVFSRGEGAFVAAAAGPHVCCWALQNDASAWGVTGPGMMAGHGAGVQAMQAGRTGGLRRERASEARPEVVLRTQMTDVTCLNWQLRRGLVTGGRDGSVVLWEHE